MEYCSAIKMYIKSAFESVTIDLTEPRAYTKLRVNDEKSVDLE